MRYVLLTHTLSLQAAASTSGRLPLASCSLAEVHTASFYPSDRPMRAQTQVNSGEPTNLSYSIYARTLRNVRPTCDQACVCRGARRPAPAEQEYVHSNKLHTESCKLDVPPWRKGHGGKVLSELWYMHSNASAIRACHHCTLQEMVLLLGTLGSPAGVRASRCALKSCCVN